MSRDELAYVGLERDRSSNWILGIFGAVGSESRHLFRIELEQAFHNFFAPVEGQNGPKRSRNR
ncbi:MULTISPECIES: hypothetical protein [Rhizobium]|uniref:hypothetical protein n=1 Tax=Rhizobium TaxID=379 RepID=UPI00142DFED7|nr:MULTISPECIES: hypothetical protein [Rhizobium]